MRPRPNALRPLIEVVRNGGLLLELLRKEYTVRYRQSVMGPLWAFLQPAILLVLFIMVQNIIHIDSGTAPYPLLVYVALVPWTFFATSMNVATGSIVGNAPILRKMYCPRAAFPLAAILTCLLDYLMALPLLGALLAYYGIGLSSSAAWVPLLLLLQLIFCYGLVLITSAVGAYRRDALIGMPYLMQFWLFASPVMYRIESVPERWRAIYELNPMADIVEGYRSALIYGTPPDMSALGPAIAITAATFACGLVVFASLEDRFADVV